MHLGHHLDGNYRSGFGLFICPICCTQCLLFGSNPVYNVHCSKVHWWWPAPLAKLDHKLCSLNSFCMPTFLSLSLDNVVNTRDLLRMYLAHYESERRGF